MEHEFIDEMLERLLVDEQKTFGKAFEQIIQERAKTIRDLGRIENAYQLFCKKFPAAKSHYFRLWIYDTRREDFEKCAHFFKWEKPTMAGKPN